MNKHDRTATAANRGQLLLNTVNIARDTIRQRLRIVNGNAAAYEKKATGPSSAWEDPGTQSWSPIENLRAAEREKAYASGRYEQACEEIMVLETILSTLEE